MNDYFEDIGLWPRGARNITRKYVLGFVLSLICTLGAYVLIWHPIFPAELVLIGIVALALIQLVVQLECFLHLGSERSVRTRLLALGVALGIITILISGTLWIMYNLNQRMMPSTQQMEQYMNDQGGF